MASMSQPFLVRHRWPIALVLIIVLGLVLYTRKLTTNPRGFFIDESSIAYNAATIAQTGHDEFGIASPLYFRAFGEYKNPVFIYLLAGIYRFTGPSILVARLLSALLGVATALVLGLIGWRSSKQPAVGVMVILMTLATPWLFALSRVVVEVALYPLAIALFLLAVQRASEKARWLWSDVLAIAAALALVTYAYSIGRLLGPLLVLGLLMFSRRAGLFSIVRVWIAYVITFAPMLIFRALHPGALESRFYVVTILTPHSSYFETVIVFARHYLNNVNPWRMLVTGDPNAYQIVTTYGVGPILLVTFVLAVASLWLLLIRKQLNAWWSFVIYGLFVSIVPASLTKEYFHLLRLSPLPVFILVLTIPALTSLVKQRTALRQTILAAAALLVLVQGGYFLIINERHANDVTRLNMFDADYPLKILPTAIAASGSQPIYLANAPAIPGYIQALWYATLENIPLGKFVVLEPDAVAPDGAVIISTEDGCPRCETVFVRSPYHIFVAKGAPFTPARLTDDAFQAEIRPLDYPLQMQTGNAMSIRVAVKNLSSVVWHARERIASPFQINVGNHWLSNDGTPLINDDGRATLPRDLGPGQQCELSFTITAPATPGEYVLEIDMVQEGVSWFGLKGSKTWRGRVKVN
jgi:4-amino-4-deoxy-L-arabinose transferase-like glycosyltransferase